MIKFQKFLVLNALLVMVGVPSLASAAEITVSAASSLTNAMKEAARVYEAAHPKDKIVLNFGSSDSLIPQVAQGAPVDILAFADQEAMDKAQAQNLIVDQTRRNFVSNTMVLVVPGESKVAINTLEDLKKPEIKRLILGNPNASPFGRYARRALDAQGLWPALESKTIHALNVRQALEYIAQGVGDAAFVYTTDAFIFGNKVKVAMSVPLDVPVVYPIARVKATKHPVEAQSFIDYLTSPEGLAVLSRHGFTKP